MELVGDVVLVDELTTGTIMLTLELLLNEELLGSVEKLLGGKMVLALALELNLLLRLEVVKIEDELEIGYKTLLELERLLDPELEPILVVPGSGTMVLVVLSLEVVDAPALADDESFVDTDGRVDPDGSADPEDSVVDEVRTSAEDFVDADELVDAEELDKTLGLKMTMAKILPGASLLLCALN